MWREEDVIVYFCYSVVRVHLGLCRGGLLRQVTVSN